MAFQVLLVDDNVDQTMLVNELIAESELPIELKTMHSPVAALDYLKDQSADFIPNVLLLDIRMPKMSGFDVLQAIKADQRLKVLPCVMFSSSTRDDDIRTSYEFGANSYAVKPTSLGDYTVFFQHLLEYWSATVETVSIH